MQKMIQLNVTARDIKRGHTSSTSCPVALALRRQMKIRKRDKHRVGVSGKWVLITEKGKTYKFADKTSKKKTSLSDFVRRFDWGYGEARVEPTKLFLVRV